MTLNNPSQKQFQDAIQSLTNILQTQQPSLDVKKGSSIRQLVIRPFAFCYSKIIDLISNWIQAASFKNLENSLETQNIIADSIASNFFVQRNRGNYSRGYITLTLNSNSLKIPIFTAFHIDGHIFKTEKTYIITNSTYTNTQDTQYIKATKSYSSSASGALYKVNIPVISTEDGYLEIPAGVYVTLVDDSLPFIQSIDVMSPISGGSGVQTDASMIQRCKNRVLNSIGTKASIEYKLQSIKSSILSCNLIDSSNSFCYRSRINTDFNIPGIIDIHAKTINQPSIQKVDCALVKIQQNDNVLNKLLEILEIPNDSVTHYVILKQPAYAGLISVKSVKVTQKDTDPFNIKYYSTYLYRDYQDDVLSPQLFLNKQKAYRLSAQQITIIFINQLDTKQASTVSVEFQYMPNIYQQNALLNSGNAFTGLDTLIKAALPAVITLKAFIKADNVLTEDNLTQIKNQIASIINNKKVGDVTLNMDDVAQKLHSIYPSVRLYLPYTIAASIYTIDGDITNISSVNGVLSLQSAQKSYNIIDSSIYFFSTTPSYISLQVLK